MEENKINGMNETDESKENPGQNISESVSGEAADDSTIIESGRYEALLHLERNLWTYGSPIIFDDCVLLRDTEKEQNRLVMGFININEEPIKNVDVTVFASDDEENAEQLNHRYVALNQKYLTKKGDKVRLHVENDEARKFVIKVNRVEFENGSVWEKEDAYYESAGEIGALETFAKAKAKDYEDNYISGKEAAEKDDSASIINGIEILKKIVWYKDTEDLLKSAEEKYNITKQNEERRQNSWERREKRQQAVKKRYKIAGITAAAIVVVAIIAVVAFFIPNSKYNDAKKYIDNEKYKKAANAFEDLGGFRKSEDYLAQAYYNLGLNVLSEDDEETALDYFQKSYDASADSDYGKMAGAFLDYYEGEEALENGDYEKAMELLQASGDAASDYTLINKAGAGLAQAYYMQGKYKAAWNTIKNVYAKDTSYQSQYGEYGYGYAKYLVGNGKIKKGMEIYDTISGYTDSSDLYKSVYKQAVKLGGEGKIDEAMELLNKIKDNYAKANKLYEKMYKFNYKVRYWVGLWKHHGTVNGEKKTYRIRISEVLYKGKMCLRIVDQNNDYLGFDTIISSDNRVTQIQIGTYQIHFKLKKYYNQKITLTLQGGKKMSRELKYDGETYTMKYKKKVKE